MEWPSRNQSYAIIAAVSIAIYFNSLFCDFVFDDILAVKNNEDLNPDAPWSNLLWNDFWGTPMSQERSHKSYRPLTVMSFKLNNLLFGKDPLSYHAVNILLHALVSILYFEVCWKIRNVALKHSSLNCNQDRRRKKEVKDTDKVEISYGDYFTSVPHIAAALFVTHPVHCEAVTGVVGRAELLSALFMLLVFIFYAKFKFASLFCSSLFCICAVASKEQGITVAAICAVYDIFVANKLTPSELILFRKSSNIGTGLRVSILSFVSCLALLFRLVLMGGNLPAFTEFDNPAAVTESPARQLTFNFLLAQNSWLLVNPSSLICDWTMGTLPVISNFFDVRNIATLLFWAIFILLAFLAATKMHSTAKLVIMGLSFLVFPFLPASNLFFPVGFVVAERILYVPSMGYCLLISVGISTLINHFPKFKAYILCIVAFVILCFSAKTIMRNSDWKSEYTLFNSGLKQTKNNAKIWNNIGHTYEENDPKTALLYFSEAARIQPNDIGSHLNVGRMKRRLEFYAEAEESYRKAIKLLPQPIPGKQFTARIAPDHLQVFVQLGNVIKMDDTRLAEADALYKQALSMRNDFVDAYINRGEILIRMGKMEEAIQCYQDALLHTEKKDDVYFNLAVVYSQTGNMTGAVEYYTYAIQDNPNHIKALYNSAVIFEETGNKELIERAKIRVERVLKLEPDNYLALSLMGSICLDNGDEVSAVSYWKRVLKTHPRDRATLYNMAYMYSKKPNGLSDTLHAIKTLLEAHPNYVKGHMFHGDILLNRKKDPKAAGETFQKIISIEPNNTKARHNYCVTVLEEGRLSDAEKCMEEVLVQAPHAKYVADNLAIIRKHIAKRTIEKYKVGFPGQEHDTEEKSSEHSKETIPPPQKQEPIEEDIFIEPIRKKPSFTKRAQAILSEAKAAAKNVDGKDTSTKLESIEHALKKVKASVRKLTNINQQVSNDVEKKCSMQQEENKNNMETDGQSNPAQKNTESLEELKKKALKVLEELEAGLD